MSKNQEQEQNYSCPKREYRYRHIRYMPKPMHMSKQHHVISAMPDMHFHDVHEILIIEGGKYKVNAPTLLYTGEGPCVVLFKMGIYHSTVRIDCEKTPFDCYVMNYAQSMMDSVPPYMLNTDVLKLSDVFIVPTDTETLNSIKPLCDELRRISKAYGEGEPMPAEGYGYFIVLWDKILRLLRSTRSMTFGTNSDPEYYIAGVIKSVLEAVERGKDVSVSELSDTFFVSRSKLSKDFHTATGTTIKTMTNELKLERVKKLLREGRENKEIAAMCGFSSESYFVQFFNKYMNMSPGAYRSLRPDEC